MHRCATIAALALALGMFSAHLFAAPTWCSTNHPNDLLCEDWDRYCAEPPSDPTQACPAGSPRGGTASFWQDSGAGCAGLSLEDFWLTTTPFSGRAPSSGDLGNTFASLAPFILNKFGSAYTQIMATDDTPIVLEFVVDAPPNKLYYTNMYMELTNAGQQPLVDYIVSDNCATKCGSTAVQTTFPIICRQSPTPSSGMGTCPPVSTAPILPSIAAGFVSYLDTNPCHCELSGSTDHFPRTYHLSFFDGKQWWTLNQSMFPGTFPGEGDFLLHERKTQNTSWAEPGPNRVRLTIKATTVKVELTYVTAAVPEGPTSWCEIPRQYLGPFYILKFGYAEPCRLKNGQWECATIRQCVNQKIGATTTMDNISLSGGIGYTEPGACCIIHNQESPATITCVQANGEMDCAQTHGGQFKGTGTVCGQVPCCPPFLPDHDMDTDVDLEDFGWFQACLSSAQFVEPPTVDCKCANLDGDTDVDASDFTIFANCLSGPGVPANTGCMGN